MSSSNLGNQPLDVQVADALEHLWDFSYLGRHPLAKAECVKHRMSQNNGESHVDTGRMLSRILQDAIENLKQTPQEAETSREKYYYAILHKAYIDGVDNKAIAHSLNIGDRTFYRYSIKAIQSIAQILCDWGK